MEFKATLLMTGVILWNSCRSGIQASKCQCTCGAGAAGRNVFQNGIFSSNIGRGEISCHDGRVIDTCRKECRNVLAHLVCMRNCYEFQDTCVDGNIWNADAATWMLLVCEPECQDVLAHGLCLRVCAASQADCIPDFQHLGGALGDVLQDEQCVEDAWRTRPRRNIRQMLLQNLKRNAPTEV